MEYVETQIFESQTNRREEKNESSRAKSNSPVQSIYTLFFCDQKQEVIQDAVDCAKIVRRRFLALRFSFFCPTSTRARGRSGRGRACVFWQLVTTKREFDFRLFRLSYSDSIIEEKGSGASTVYYFTFEECV